MSQPGKANRFRVALSFPGEHLASARPALASGDRALARVHSEKAEALARRDWLSQVRPGDGEAEDGRGRLNRDYLLDAIASGRPQ